MKKLLITLILLLSLQAAVQAGTWTVQFNPDSSAAVFDGSQPIPGTAVATWQPQGPGATDPSGITQSFQVTSSLDATDKKAQAAFVQLCQDTWTKNQAIAAAAKGAGKIAVFVGTATGTALNASVQH